MARPGATVQLGSDEGVSMGIRIYEENYAVISGLRVTGSQAAGAGIEMGANGGAPYNRIVNNLVQCPDCINESAGIEGAWKATRLQG